jgi:AAA family ATP:ADP antiporter
VGKLKKMKEILARLFALHPGEEKKTFQLAFLGLLWSFVATTGLKFADSLFLANVGADALPGVYQWVSLALILLSFILLYVFHHISSYKILRFFLISGILFYGICHFLYLFGPNLNLNWLWYGLRIWGNLFLTVLMTSYWTFIDQYLHKNDAKRLFGLFSSMIFIGMVLTGLVMNTSWLSLNTLFPILIAVLTFALWWIRSIHQKFKPDHEEATAHPEMCKETASITSMIKIIFSSPYSLFIISVNFLTFFLWVITEFNYLSAFNAHFPTPQDQPALSQFLGKWVMIIASVNLFFGLFLYGRLVRRFGIGTVLLYTPLLFCLTFTGWIFDTTLLFPLMGFFIVEGSLYIVDDSNFSLLLKSGPTPIKSKLRVLIESFFEPIGMLLSGLLLSCPEINSKMVGLVLSCLLIFVVVVMKKKYFSPIAYKS